ncbi:MAG: VOC family protein [Acidobacteriota bacterium]
MTSKPALIPQPAVTPNLTIKGAASAIEFYKKAFGATETMRLVEPSGRIGHAEMTISGSPIMISDEYPELDVLSPQSRGGSAVGIHVYVEDVDEVFARAVAEGAKALGPVADEFHGDRVGKLVDPFGHVWYVSTRKEDLSAEEVTQRYDALMKQ